VSGKDVSSKKPITPEGYRRFQKELESLWHGERPRVVQEVADAAAHGDRSENAEYIYGKKRLREIDRRIRYLSGLLENLQIVEPTSMACDKVKFGATVEYEDEDGNRRRYQLVGEDEVDAKQGRISAKSPIGRAILGKKVGDVVTIKRPAGDVDAEVLQILYV
jgi:transcription elongation factor GreB